MKQMKFKIIFLLIITTSILCCNKIDKKNLEVVEGIQLGTTYSDYIRQIDSLEINIMSFYTEWVLLSQQDLESNQISTYVTDIFNFSDYRNSNLDINHYGILYPTTIQGTKNVFALNVILGHTGMVFGNSKYDKKKCFNQNVAGSYIDKIREMLTSKYGTPVFQKFEPSFFVFYVLEGSDINVYKVDESRKGKVTIWENEYLQVTLFEGLPSIDAKFTNNKTYQMVVPVSGEYEIITEFNWDEGERPCVTYAYIQYELKSEVIDKLGLNDKKI
jgi:hypothetical protein